MHKPRQTQILDTTLREGEQCFGVFFPIEVKKQIALLLDRIGVDFIEVGHPAAAPSIEQAVSAIARLRLKANLIAHARLDRDEIRLVKDLGLKWVGLFCGINDLAQRKYSLSGREIFKKATAAVHFAKGLGLSVKFACEDSSRTELADLRAFFRHLVSMGVERVSYADTLGTLTPDRLRNTFRILKAELPPSIIHFHLHDDTGHALRNAIIAVSEQAGCIDTSVLGIAERAGIVPLERVLDVLNMNGIFDDFARHAKRITHLSALVASCRNLKHYTLRRSAHKSGIHINGVLKDRTMYETDHPEQTGRQTILVLSKLIGISGLQQILRTYGYQADDRGTERMLKIIKNEELLELAGQEEIEDYFRSQGAQNARGVSTAVLPRSSIMTSARNGKSS